MKLLFVNLNLGSYPHTPQVLILKPVHELVRVGFVPNSESTWPNWVVRISTHSRPEWLIGSGELELQWMLDKSVRIEDMKNSENPTRNRWKTVEIKWEKFWKTVEIWLDLARSNKILTILGKISTRSGEISQDLA